MAQQRRSKKHPRLVRSNTDPTSEKSADQEKDPLVRMRRILEPSARDYFGTSILEGLQVQDIRMSLYPPLQFPTSMEYNHPAEAYEFPEPEEDLLYLEERAALSDFSTPLYSLEELEHCTLAFLLHLDRNRIPLIETGHP